MNPMTESPVRPPIVPSTPALPVSTKPEPLSDYAVAQWAALPVVPPIPSPKPPGPDSTEPDPWKAMTVVQARADKLRQELAKLACRLEAAKAQEVKLVADDLGEEDELVDRVSKAQALTKVLAARHTRLLSQEGEARQQLRDRIDYARVSLEQQAQGLRAERVAAHLEMLAKRIEPQAFALLPVAESARDVIALNEFVQSNSIFSSFIRGRPSSPELRSEQLAQEVKRVLALRERFATERSKRYDFA